MRELYIGLMSGTSLDGCDAALTAIDGDSVALLDFMTHPMPERLREQILSCCSPDSSNVALVCSLNFALGTWFSEAVLALLRHAGEKPESISAVGSHGQTVYHLPKAEGDFVPSTLQLGEPAVIAYKTGIPVVSDMRAMDMAAGGQGAPLVPFSEYLIYRGKEAVALQNLGGIGNVTVLPADCAPEDVFAFDTGPANMLIDGLCRRLFHLPYDENGRVAQRGNVLLPLLREWMALPYISAPPPKSTGRELYGEQFIDKTLADCPCAAPEDLVATATRYTALAMRRNYDLYVFPRVKNLRRVVLSGGGAHNPALVSEISSLFPECEVLRQEDLGLHSDAKEAVAFAVIARQTMHRMPGNLPSATGAKEKVPLGSITYPPLPR